MGKTFVKRTASFVLILGVAALAWIPGVFAEPKGILIGFVIGAR